MTEKAVDSEGAFATLYLAGLARPTCPGLSWPAPVDATAHVCALVPNEPGPSEIVFASSPNGDMATLH